MKTLHKTLILTAIALGVSASAYFYFASKGAEKESVSKIEPAAIDKKPSQRNEKDLEMQPNSSSPIEPKAISAHENGRHTQGKKLSIEFNVGTQALRSLASEEPEEPKRPVESTKEKESVAQTETPKEMADPIPAPPAEKPRKEAPEICSSEEASPRSVWPRFWMYLGVGANYTRIEEKSSEVKSTYPGLSAPSFAVEAGTALTDFTNIGVQYKTTPANGDNKAEDSSNLTYVWKTAGVEASTRLNRAVDQGSQWSLLYGIQYHAVPLVIFDSLTLKPLVREAQYLNASLGMKYQYFVSPRQFFVISGRYQQPLSSMSSGDHGFQMSSPLIFDGSVGSEYNLTDALWGGVYWYGQYHSFKYDYTESGALQQNTQAMIYSNIELRLSFRF